MSVSSVVSYLNLRNVLILIIPSLLGLFLFMTPVVSEKGLTIPVAMLANALKQILGGLMPLILTCIVCFSALLTLLTKLLQPTFLGVQ